MITTEQIKELRDRTGLSIMQCKQALEASAGNMDAALEDLKKQGAEIAAKKGSRALGAGLISSYIHATKTMGAIVELNSETDFVAKNPEFGALAQEIAMQIAATNPADTTALLAEPYIRDSAQTIGDLVKGGIQKFGENIEVRRFTRFSILD